MQKTTDPIISLSFSQSETSGVDAGVMLSLVGVVAGAKMVHDDVLMDVVMLCLDDLLGEFRDGKLSVFVHSARLRPMSENSWTARDEKRWRSMSAGGDTRSVWRSDDNNDTAASERARERESERTRCVLCARLT